MLQLRRPHSQYQAKSLADRDAANILQNLLVCGFLHGLHHAKSNFLNLEMVEVDFPDVSVTFTEYHDIKSCLQYYTPIVTSRHNGHNGWSCAFSLLQSSPGSPLAKRSRAAQMSQQGAENFVGFWGFRVGFLESPH